MTNADQKNALTNPADHQHGRRMRHSFLLTCVVYGAVVAAVLAMSNFDAHTRAGEMRAVSLNLAQIASAPAAPAVAAAEPAEAPKEIKKPEPRPEPKVEKKPRPEHKPKPKKTAKRKPVPQPEPVAEPVTEEAPQEAPAQAVASSNAPAPTTAQSAAPATAGEEGIATLIHGQSADPFLSAVKRSVETHLEYPRKARQFRIEGTSVVEFVVSHQGELMHLKVRESAGHPLLDKSAMRAVRRAHPSWPRPPKTLRLRFPITFRIT